MPQPPESTGLGLTGSRRLARLMDGDVSYQHDGRTSVFVPSLPLVAGRPSFAAAS
jgi:signal transduction histidine kinase